jgi:penicillin-binding protein 1A
VAGVYLGYDQPRSLGGYAQGGRISAPIWKQWAQTALKDQPKVPFVAPPGIRWVRIDRASGKPVFGSFPTTEEAQSPVIWEAFQPQTEQQRTNRSSIGDPYNVATQQQALAAWQQQQLQLQQQQQEKNAAPSRPAATPPPQAGPPVVPRAAGLPTQNAL